MRQRSQYRALMKGLRFFLAGLLLAVLTSALGCRSGLGQVSGLMLWLDIPSEVSAGGVVPLTLKVKNISARPIVLGHASPAYNFIITRPDGTEVWRHTMGRLDIILSKTVLPGEELNFTAEWDQRELKWDEHHGPVKGDLVPPGTYWVQGIFHGNLFEKVYTGGAQDLKTRPKQLVIKPSD